MTTHPRKVRTAVLSQLFKLCVDMMPTERESLGKSARGDSTHKPEVLKIHIKGIEDGKAFFYTVPSNPYFLYILRACLL